VENDKCNACGKTAFVTERVSVEGKIYHGSCFKCTHCGSKLSLAKYASMNGTYYCKPHFKQLFALKGNYNEGFGQKKLVDEWKEKAGAKPEEEN